MTAVKSRLARCLSQRGNVENLLILATITVIEIAIAVEAPYWVLAIIVTLTIFMKEATLIMLFAEEVEREIRTVAREVAAEAKNVEQEVAE
jgi:hypothetical protein